MTDIPDELIKLERSSEDARQQLAGLVGEEYEAQWKAWRTAAGAFQASVTAHATRGDVTMHDMMWSRRRSELYGTPSLLMPDRELSGQLPAVARAPAVHSIRTTCARGISRTASWSISGRS